MDHKILGQGFRLFIFNSLRKKSESEYEQSETSALIFLIIKKKNNRNPRPNIRNNRNKKSSEIKKFPVPQEFKQI